MCRTFLALFAVGVMGLAAPAYASRSLGDDLLDRVTAATAWPTIGTPWEPSATLSWLNTHPTRPLSTLRHALAGRRRMTRGPVQVGRTFTAETFTSYSLPVSRRFLSLC